ncbi:GNAT family N-acetyltransferase [Pseudomonas protegens]|nr:GNAT family N-acetyltransferase [Pseudomonas protegens]
MMKVELKSIRLRLVEELDAGFILSLRLDQRYNRFLSEVTADLEAQKSWIRKYKEDELAGLQYYFIIERLDGVPCGTVRIYDLRPDSFCWGSWILNENKTRHAAIESTLLVYDLGFSHLGFDKSHFDVMKANAGVVAFHKRMGAVVVKEDEQNYYFEITKASVERSRIAMCDKIGGC